MWNTPSLSIVVYLQLNYEELFYFNIKVHKHHYKIYQNIINKTLRVKKITEKANEICSESHVDKLDMLPTKFGVLESLKPSKI